MPFLESRQRRRRIFRRRPLLRGVVRRSRTKQHHGGTSEKEFFGSQVEFSSQGQRRSVLVQTGFEKSFPPNIGDVLEFDVLGHFSKHSIQTRGHAGLGVREMGEQRAREREKNKRKCIERIQGLVNFPLHNTYLLSNFSRSI